MGRFLKRRIKKKKGKIQKNPGKNGGVDRYEGLRWIQGIPRWLDGYDIRKTQIKSHVSSSCNVFFLVTYWKLLYLKPSKMKGKRNPSSSWTTVHPDPGLTGKKVWNHKNSGCRPSMGDRGGRGCGYRRWPRASHQSDLCAPLQAESTTKCGSFTSPPVCWIW